MSTPGRPSPLAADISAGASRPILVTGMHRSGTTWIGKILSAGGAVTYVSEPLNPVHPGIFRLPVRYDYTYIHAENERDFLPTYRDTLRLRPRPLAELAARRTPRHAGRIVVRSAQFLSGRLHGRVPLFKDPYALFSAEWFADRLDCRVVIVVRHPAAVVSSLRRLGWRAPLAGLSAQPALVRDWLEPFRDELELAARQAERRRDLIWGNAVLWKMIYSAVSNYAERRSDFLVIRHEDVSLDPEAQYASLYRRLDLPFPERARAAIRDSSAANNPVELAVGDAHSIRLDSRRNLDNWRRRLNPAEVELIRESTEPVASRWYLDADWS